MPEHHLRGSSIPCARSLSDLEPRLTECHSSDGHTENPHSAEPLPMAKQLLDIWTDASQPMPIEAASPDFDSGGRLLRKV
ncbi:hypothetical protein KCU62_g323, partial [Aureobasidium sp. EXF-3399]